MARNFSSDGQYRIELAVKVWRQLETLPEPAVRRIQSWLYEQAKGAALLEATEAVAPIQRLRTSVDGHEVTWEISVARRTVTLMHVAPNLPEAK